MAEFFLVQWLDLDWHLKNELHRHANVKRRQNFQVRLKHDFFRGGACLMPLNLGGCERVHDTHYFEVQMLRQRFVLEI